MSNPYTAWMPPGLVPDPAPRRESTWHRRPDALVHVDRIGEPDASRRVLLLHGAGGHAGLLWPYAAALAARDLHVVVPDLPGYGRTRVRRRGAVRYGDWVATAADLVRAERREHGGTLVLAGASMGGLLAYDAATRTGAVDTVVATCLLDPRDLRARRRMTRWAPLGDVAVPLMRVLAGPLARTSVPVRWLTDMRAISNIPGLTETVLADRLGGGTSVPLGFLRSYLESAPAVEPERAGQTTVVLAHPAQDRWTPVEVSLPFFARLAGPKRIVMLEGAGHLPAEEPGVSRLVDTIVDAASA